MLRTIELHPSFSGTGRGKLSITLIHTRKPPDDPPDDDDFPPGAWEVMAWKLARWEVAQTILGVLLGRRQDSGARSA